MPFLPPAPPAKVLLLINPNCRRGKEGVDAAVEVLEQGGVSVRQMVLEGPDQLKADIEAGLSEADAVVIAGGDGTLSRAGGALAYAGVPLGILPSGTANDLALTLGIPDDLSAAAEIIMCGYRRRIDLGTVNGHPFFNVASIGLSADLSKELTKPLKRRWGRLSYAIAGSRVLRKARPFTATISDPTGCVVVRTLQIAVGNGRHYGGGNVVDADARIDDGTLDLYSLELARVWKLALMLRTFRTGSHGAWSEVRTAESQEFNVTTPRPHPVNADGDIITETPAHFRVHPGAVTVFAPPPLKAPEA